jgi:molybdate transport system substrate-binding protein
MSLFKRLTRLAPMKFLHALVAGILLLQTPITLAEDITVAVASNFTQVLRELALDFQKESEHRVIVASGSSGRLYAQVVNGAPYDLFFSADAEKPAQLVADGLADAGSLVTYALGTLVLWSADPDMRVSNGEALLDPRNQRVALANPRLAPYGAAAAQVLDGMALQGITRVTGENITQAYQFVETGNVPLGFVALSQVVEEGRIQRGAGWIVPQAMYDPIRQDVVLLNHGEDSIAARNFLDFVLSTEGKNIISKYGYGTD